MDNYVFDDMSSKKRFNKILSLLFILVLTFLIFYFVTYSWFGESENGNKVFIFGNIKIIVDANLKFPDDVIEPNKIYDEMPTTISCADETEDAYLKVYFDTDYKIDNENVVSPVLFNDYTQQEQEQGKQKWIYSNADKCYYYVGYISKLENKSAIFNTGFKVVNTINNIDKDKPFNVTLKVYAIQRFYKAYESEWLDAPDEWKTEIAQFDEVVNVE